MFVFIQGSHADHNGAFDIAAITAVLSAAKYNRKTLLIQMTDIHTPQMENILIGKKMQETKTRLEMFQVEDKGIDALVRRAQTLKLVKDNFDVMCEPMLEHENMLDSIGITQKEDFEISLTVKTIRTILNQSTIVYDNVFVLLNGKNTEIMRELLELADVCITCFKQIPTKETYNEFPKTKSEEQDEKDKEKKEQRMLKVITDYDPFSTYNVFYLKKMHNTKKLFLQYRNADFRDACLSGTLLPFMLKNIGDTPEDINYEFIKHLNELMDGIMGKENWNEDFPEYETLDIKKKNQEEKTLEVIPKDDVMEEEKTVKTGIWGKVKTEKKVVLKNKNEEQNINPNDNSDVIPMEKDTVVSVVTEKTEKENTQLTRREKRNLIKKEKRLQKEKAKEEKRLQLQKEKYKENKKQNSSKEAEETHPTEKVTEMTSWECEECGVTNSGKFCSECGAKRPEAPPPPETWLCAKCGNDTNTGKFCDECGSRRPWECSCGQWNIGKFCSECGNEAPIM